MLNLNSQGKKETLGAILEELVVETIKPKLEAQGLGLRTLNPKPTKNYTRFPDLGIRGLGCLGHFGLRTKAAEA